MDSDKIIDDLLKLYLEMSQVFSKAQENSKVTCPAGCGFCCETPTVEASPLEMLPMAKSLIDQGLAEVYLERLQTEDTSRCMIYESHGGKKGRCTQYATRPSLCRQFALAALIKKDGSATLSICKELKETYPFWVDLNPEDFPVMNEWTSKLMALHPDLLKHRQPISIALREALEKLMLLATFSHLK
jgi:uncharacterized protein